MKKKEQLKSLVSNEKPNTVSRNKERISSRARLRESQQIALKVLTKLDEIGWSQKKLAEEMGVSPQQITKIVKGSENFTLETQIKIQEILDIPILATYYERKHQSSIGKVISVLKFENSSNYISPKFQTLEGESITASKQEHKMNYNTEVKYKASLMIA
jgi:transcriptional regulator with XRE-family HTH domain